MIVINILLNEQNFSMSVIGHAEYNPGNDVVCSACSIITQTFCRYVSDMGFTDAISEEEGTTKIEGKTNSDIKRILDFIITGYQGLADTYPDNVRLEVVNESIVYINI